MEALFHGFFNAKKEKVGEGRKEGRKTERRKREKKEQESIGGKDR